MHFFDEIVYDGNNFKLNFYIFLNCEWCENFCRNFCVVVMLMLSSY